MTGHKGHEIYGQAMLAKALFAFELAKRYPQITSSSVHPGTVKSAVWGGEKDINWFIRNVMVKPVVALTGVSNDEGAKGQLWLSFSNEVQNGHYYEPVGVAGKESKFARDSELSRKAMGLDRQGTESPWWIGLGGELNGNLFLAPILEREDSTNG